MWGSDFLGDSNLIDVYIRYLRGKIDDGFEDKLIQTVRGVGYALKGLTLAADAHRRVLRPADRRHHRARCDRDRFGVSLAADRTGQGRHHRHLRRDRARRPKSANVLGFYDPEHRARHAREQGAARSLGLDRPSTSRSTTLGRLPDRQELEHGRPAAGRAARTASSERFTFARDIDGAPLLVLDRALSRDGKPIVGRARRASGSTSSIARTRRAQTILHRRRDRRVLGRRRRLDLHRAAARSIRSCGSPARWRRSARSNSTAACAGSAPTRSAARGDVRRDARPVAGARSRASGSSSPTPRTSSRRR